MSEKGRKHNLLLAGILEVLLSLKNGRKTFTELKRVVRMSPNTVLKHLRESQEKGLVKQDLSPEKGRKPKIKYGLTEEGKSLLSEYESIIDRYVELREELNKLEMAVRDKQKKIKYLLSYGETYENR